MNSNFQEIGRLTTVRRNILRKVRQVGVLQTIKHGMRRLIRDFKDGLIPLDNPHAHRFDEIYGTDTAKGISVGALDIPDDRLAHSNRYEAVLIEEFDAIMLDLPIRHEEYIFVDVGSGKGRALLLASRFPFREVVGVEISPALTEIANNNVRLFKDEGRKCRKITTLCLDGSLYEPHPGRVVLYLYNPFDEQVMRPFLSNVERSLRNSPRRMFVVYLRPLLRHLWDESDAFELVRSTERYVIYQNRL